MNVFMKTVAGFCVVVIGSSLGAHMHQRVQKHDAELRAPGMIYNRNVQQKMEGCLRPAVLDSDRCMIESGITI